MNPDDLLEIADSLASGRIGSRRGRPKQAELRRAVSATYYALFHCLARNCADLLVGGRSSTRTRKAWQQLYRALDHGRAKRRCRHQTLSRFPQQIRNFANQFVTMQEQRHLADYDPLNPFSRSAVSLFIDESRTVITDFENVDRDDRRAFAVFVLFDLRRN